MRRFSNYRYLEGARFVRVARTAPAYTLVSLGAYPAMLEGGTTSVRGEIYEVDDVTLAAIDRLEGHPTRYERKAVRLARGRGAEAYVMKAESAAEYRAVTSGCWSFAR